MDTFKAWNARQKQLQALLRSKADIHDIIDLISLQHQAAHVAAINASTPEQISTAEDELWAIIDEENFRSIPTKSIYSVAWHLWHSARIEDITANSFISNKPQILEKYQKALNVPFIDTGNAMDLAKMQLFNTKINKMALYEYRVAVGRNTQADIHTLEPELLKKNVTKEALKLIKDQGYVVEQANWLLEFWSRKTIAGIILMPLTRHLMVHINEAKRLIPKKKKKQN
jgi:hypothetical protein